jgi:hypothetical protein
VPTLRAVSMQLSTDAIAMGPSHATPFHATAHARTRNRDERHVSVCVLAHTNVADSCEGNDEACVVAAIDQNDQRRILQGPSEGG